MAQAGLVPVRDPSNEDERFDRVRVRRALADVPGLDVQAISRSAGLLQDAEDVVERAVADVAWRHIFRDEGGIWFHPGHARLAEVEAVAAILAELGAETTRSAVAQMVACSCVPMAMRR